MRRHSLLPAAVRHSRFAPNWVSLGLLTCALTLWLSLTVQAGSVAELDRANGLPDAQLGSTVSNFAGLVKTEDLGRYQTYKRPADKLYFGKFPVESIEYIFFKDRLYTIVMTVAEKRNVRGLVKTFDQTYGKDHTNDSLPIPKTTRTLDVREWDGTKVICVLKTDSDETSGELRFIDKATWDLLEAPRREKREANKQLLNGSFMNGDFDKKPAASPAPDQAAPAPNQAAPPPSQ